VCPDHGKPFLETGAGLAALRTNLENLQAIVRPNNKRPAEREPSQNYGPHLVFVGEPVTYAIVSDSRHAILVDPGYLNEQDLQTFQKKFDIVNIDAITYTHYHDDHVARSIENLYGWVGKNVGPLKTSIWVFEAMADVLAHPQRYNIPCLFPVPIEPDRIIRAGEVVKWEGLELNFVHFPGQTWYHTAIIVTANGRTYALTGDSVWGPADRTRPINGPVIPRNRYFLGHGHEVVFQTLIDRNVDTILPSHYAPFEVTRSDLERSLAWAYSIAPAVATLTDQPHPGYAMDPHWAHFYPYRVAVRQGSGKASADVSLLIRNYFDRPTPVDVSLVLPAGLEAHPARKKATLPPGQTVSIDFQLRISEQQEGTRRVVLADMWFDGRYLGQITELVVDSLLPVPDETLK
jgi:glyoxylase-like metal-dependent hydrolase (beta-lactamase superfamily II)